MMAACHAMLSLSTELYDAMAVLDVHELALAALAIASAKECRP